MLFFLKRPCGPLCIMLNTCTVSIEVSAIEDSLFREATNIHVWTSKVIQGFRQPGETSERFEASARDELCALACNETLHFRKEVAAVCSVLVSYSRLLPSTCMTP